MPQCRKLESDNEDNISETFDLEATGDDFPEEPDKVCMYEEMMTNNDNVESSLLTSNLLKICSLYNFCYKLHMLSCRGRVVSSMMCVVQVISVGNI